MSAFGYPHGHYLWTYSAGSFSVDLRPSGVFYCPKFPAQATFGVDASNTLQVDWKNFGKYTLASAEGGKWEGSKLGEPSNWRKMEFVSAFTAEEQLLQGLGGGSRWDFQWEKGSFEVELRCDGFNHFVCNQYPSHSHWTSELLADGRCKVDINWGQYGEYELLVDAATQTMTGHKKGQPTNWRRAIFKTALGADALASVPAHDHSHKHEHGETCTHDH